MIRIFVIVFCLCVSCVDQAAGEPESYLALVLEEGIYSSLEQQINQYKHDIRSEGYGLIVLEWGTSSGGAPSLRAYLHALDIEGAWLLGNLPVVWYENTETFPFDTYFTDADAEWFDADRNGAFEGHSVLNPTIFVSRLIGSVDQIAGYFDKIHRYRETVFEGPSRAVVYRDNTWADYWPGATWGLENIYQVVDVVEGPSQISEYVRLLTTDSVDFVYQWVHAGAEHMAFDDGIFTVEDVVRTNLRGRFYNMFNCSASRYTETNLAHAYLLQTDFGLATIGSTERGGIYSPEHLHTPLGAGSTWGDAFLEWYIRQGIYNDSWYLGIVITGDPLLKIKNRMLSGV